MRFHPGGLNSSPDPYHIAAGCGVAKNGDFVAAIPPTAVRPLFRDCLVDVREAILHKPAYHLENTLGSPVAPNLAAVVPGPASGLPPNFPTGAVVAASILAKNPGTIRALPRSIRSVDHKDRIAPARPDDIPVVQNAGTLLLPGNIDSLDLHVLARDANRPFVPGSHSLRGPDCPCCGALDLRRNPAARNFGRHKAHLLRNVRDTVLVPGVVGNNGALLPEDVGCMFPRPGYNRLPNMAAWSCPPGHNRLIVDTVEIAPVRNLHPNARNPGHEATPIPRPAPLADIAGVLPPRNPGGPANPCPAAAHAPDSNDPHPTPVYGDVAGPGPDPGTGMIFLLLFAHA